MGIDAAIEKALDSSTTATDGLYVTFDNDSMIRLVPATAPRSAASRARDDEARHGVGRAGFSFLDVAELSPLYDSSNIIGAPGRVVVSCSSEAATPTRSTRHARGPAVAP